MTDDLANDPEFEKWAERVRTELIPKLKVTSMTVSICPGGEAEEFDVKFAVELGASIMLNKPIIVAVPPGVTVPERLVRVADEIVELTAMNDETGVRIGEAIDRVVRRLDCQ